jgi:large subunit ribosomal protein L29
MSHPLADEARTLDDQTLAQAINEGYRELFNLQFQRGTRQLQDPGSLARARHQIARLRTVQRERAIAVMTGTPLAPLAASEPAPISPQKQRAIDAAAEAEAAAAAQAAAAEAAAEAADKENAASDTVDATLHDLEAADSDAADSDTAGDDTDIDASADRTTTDGDDQDASDQPAEDDPPADQETE